MSRRLSPASPDSLFRVAASSLAHAPGRHLGLALAAAVGLGSCTMDKVTAVEVTELTLASPSITLLVGEQQQLSVTVRDQDGNVVSPSIVTWSAQPASVIGVDPSGSVTALGPGTGTVEASAQGVSAAATVVVQPGPEIRLSTSDVDIVGLLSAPSARSTELRIDNGGAGTLDGLVADVAYPPGAERGWLTPDLAGTTAPTTLRLAANATGLLPGEYEAEVRIASPVASNSPVVLPVVLRLVDDRPVLEVSPSSVAFAAVAGGLPSPPQVVRIVDGAGGTLDGLEVALDFETASGWLTGTLSSDRTPAELTLTADAGALTPGSYGAVARITAPGATAGPAVVSVALNVGSVADLEVVQTGPDSVAAGERADFLIVVRNEGPSAAEEVVVENVLPAGTTLETLPPGATRGPGTLRWAPGRIDPGAELRFPFALRVGADRVTSLRNTVTVSSPTLTRDPSSRLSEQLTKVYRSADLEVSLSAPDDVGAGEEAVLGIVVRNRGPSDAAAVRVRDTLPDGVQFVSATGGGEAVGRVVVWPARATLSPGDSIAVQATVAVPVDRTTPVTTTAVAEAATPDPVAANNVAAVTTSVLREADVAALAGGEETVEPGGRVLLQAGVLNLGPATARGVTVTDSIPDGVTVVSVSDGGSESGGIVTWPPVDALAPGDSVVYEVVAEVDAERFGELTHRVRVGSESPADPDPGNDTAAATTTVQIVADLALQLLGPDAVVAGTTASYSVVVRNDGPDDARDVQISDRLPPALSVTDAGGGVLAPDGLLTWPLVPFLAPGDSVVRDIEVAVDPAAEGELVQTALVTTAAIDPDSTNDRASLSTVASRVANVAVEIDGPESAAAGEPVSWVVRVTNAGPSIATEVAVTDSLSEGLTLIEDSGGATDEDGILAWPVVDVLAPGAELAYEVTALVDPALPGPHRNVAEVAAVSLDPEPADDRAVLTTSVPDPANLRVTASAPSVVEAGESVEYEVRVQNGGPAAAVDLVLTGSLPDGVEFLGADRGGTVTDGVVTWTRWGLFPGTGRTFRLRVGIPEDFEGPLTVSFAARVDNPDPDPDDNRVEVTVTVEDDSP